MNCRCLKQHHFDDDYYKALYALWCDSKIPVREIDFLRRTALGGLKTGEVVSKYRIPGTRVGCVFCVCKLETTEHLFSECPGLNEVREIILESLERIGATVDRTDRQSVKEMCCPGLAQIEESYSDRQSQCVIVRVRESQSENIQYGHPYEYTCIVCVFLALSDSWLCVMGC